MINVTDLRPNKTYEDEGEIYVVIDVLLNKTAMAKMKAVVKRKNLRTGTTTEKMYMSGDRVNDAHIDKKAMVFSYIEGDDYYFMDNETYEQVPISIAKLEWEKNFLRENAPVEISYYQDEILGIALPVKVPL
jgi:elongation factor P